MSSVLSIVSSQTLAVGVGCTATDAERINTLRQLPDNVTSTLPCRVISGSKPVQVDYNQFGAHGTRGAPLYCGECTA